MKLEQQMYEIPRIGKEKIYSVGDLESLSATALYYGEGSGSSGFAGGGFGGIGKRDMDKYGIVGSSNPKVILPESNSIERSLKILTPSTNLVINRYKRIKGPSGIDYFNLDGSLAGRILGLNKSELDYLDD